MTTRSDHEVAAAREALRYLLNRRNFVVAGLTASASLLGLAGCSSDSGGGSTAPPPSPPGSGSIPAGLTGVTGSVTLPPGSSLSPTSLSVSVLTQRVSVSATGGFTIGLSTDGPALGLLVDSGGDGVLMALLDAGAASHSVSAHTTGVALLFYAIDAYLLPGTAMSQVAALLDADPALPALADAVSQAVAADPHALANNAAPLGPAVITALQTIFGTTSLTRRPPLAAAAMDPAPPLMLVNPSDPQNGVMVNQDTDTNSLLISNTKRRGCRVYVYETATVTGANSPPVPVSPAKLVAGPFDLDATESLGVVTALKDVVQGTSPWAPVNLAPIPLSLADGTDRTLYQVILLAASLQAAPANEAAFEPAFFRDPIYVNEVAAWRDDLQTLLATCVMGQILLPILCFMGGLGALVGSYTVIKGLAADAKAFGSATFKFIIDNLGNGSLGALQSGLAKTVQEAVASPTSAAFWKPEVQAVISQARATTLQAESVTTFAEQLGSGLKMFMKIFAPIFAAGVLLDGIDLGAVIHDFAQSDLADSWMAALIRQALTLAPQNPSVNAGDRVTFSVSNPAGTLAGQYVYDWTQTSPFAQLSANGEDNIGAAITTAQRSVDLVTSGSDINPITVLVIGYDTSTGSRVEIGRAGTVVSFLLPAEITPTNRIASVGDQVVFVVAVSGNVPAGPLSYKWTLTGTGGSIGDSNVVTTSQPAVTWTAQNPGQADNVHVDVYSGTKLIARADVAISVVGAPFIDFTIAGPWDPAFQPPNGQYRFEHYVGLRDVSPGGGGNDGIFLGYAVSATIEGASIAILIPSGSTLRAGQVLGKFGPGRTTNDFQFDVSQDVTMSGEANQNQTAPMGVGTLTVTAIGQQTNNEWAMFYSFQITNGNGGSIVGTGLGKWGALGTPVNS